MDKMNLLQIVKNLGLFGKDILNKSALNQNPSKEITKSLGQTETNPAQSLVETKSNIPLNQQILNSPSLNQSALNTLNKTQTNLNQNLKETSNTKNQPTPSQVDFRGAPDIPAYAGVANMSLKSWIAQHDNRTTRHTESLEKELTATLEGIKGFQKENYDGFDDESSGKGFLKQSSKTKKLQILSHIFSTMATIEHSGSQEADLIVRILNFKKLGSSLQENKHDNSEATEDLRLSPPLPEELQKLDILNASQVKYLHELLALPSEFPECVRFFAKDNLKLNEKDINSFLVQRFRIVQEQLFGAEDKLSGTIAQFVSLLNQNNYTSLLPLVLLYYPLPLPRTPEKYDYIKEWEKQTSDKNQLIIPLIASCEIYYVSKSKGRFLIKLELNENREFSVFIQTSQNNTDIVKSLELAIAEVMFLLENPPLLSELNVFLTQEIYEATDINEELAIVSTGSLRLEIVLGTYAALHVLNKLNTDPDPSGLIDISE